MSVSFRTTRRRSLAAALAALAFACVAGTTIPAGARAPDGARPGTACKASYISSQPQKAKKLDKAKQRARGNWEYQAWKKYGRKFNDWGLAQYRQYGCSKQGKHHFCVAEAFACDLDEVSG